MFLAAPKSAIIKLYSMKVITGADWKPILSREILPN